MKNFIYIVLSVLILSCAQEKRPLLGKTAHQLKQNSFFKDASTSPLKDKDRKKFKGLDFFDVDSSYVVEANLKATPDSEPFEMKTSTSRLPVYKKYGEVSFKIKGEAFKLNIYQNLEMEDENYLFLPFMDDTNGETSYSGGRYIETSIPQGNILKIDFNTAFNPYCTYNEKYSCPIVPRENYLPTEIKAGVKKFNKH